MKFHRYRSLKAMHAARGTQADIVRVLLASDSRVRPIVEIERHWHTDRRPYYRVWPGILPALLGLRLDRVTCDHIRLPVRTVCIEMPVGRSIPWGAHEVMTIHCDRSTDGLRLMLVASDHDATTALYELCLPRGDLVEDQLPLGSVSADSTMEWASAVWEPVTRLVVCLCLIRDDPTLIVPRALEADRDKWERTHDIALIERARRRGENGWDVGRDVPEHDDHAQGQPAAETGRTVSPHYRRAHAALVWTGEGRQVPRIVLRRGAFVRGAELGKIPQGFYGDDDRPACPYCLRPMVHISGRWGCEDCEAAAARVYGGAGVPIRQTGGSAGRRVIRDPRGLS